MRQSGHNCAEADWGESTHKTALCKVQPGGQAPAALLQPVIEALKGLLATTLQHHFPNILWGFLKELTAGHCCAYKAAWVQLLQDAACTGPVLATAAAEAHGRMSHVAPYA